MAGRAPVRRFRRRTRRPRLAAPHHRQDLACQAPRAQGDGVKTVQARHYTKGRISPIRLIVVHSMEWTETTTTAEDCARMFSTMTRQASAHVCVDSNSAVRCVADK